MEPADLSLIIGVLAICAGEITLGKADAVASHMLQRWKDQGVLPADAGVQDVLQLLEVLGQRVRYAKGEYLDDPS